MELSDRRFGVVRRSLTYAIILSTAFVNAVTAFAEPPRLPRDNLLLYRDAEGKPQPVRSLDDWSKRRNEIIRGAASVMGKLPGKEKFVPLDVQIEEEVDGGTYVRRLITYASEPNCRTPAYLLVPKDVLAGTRKSAGDFGATRHEHGDRPRLDCRPR